MDSKELAADLRALCAKHKLQQIVFASTTTDAEAMRSQADANVPVEIDQMTMLVNACGAFAFRAAARLIKEMGANPLDFLPYMAEAAMDKTQAQVMPDPKVTPESRTIHPMNG